MIYIDYTWDLSSTLIIPDQEIDTKQLNWQAGDYWQMVEQNGKIFLRKVDPMVKFLIEGKDRGCS
jgi:hypothetical protein